MARRLGMIAALALLVLLPAPPARSAGCAGVSGCPYLDVHVLGKDPQGHGVFRFPQAVAFSPGGSYVWVADQHSALVQKFDRQGAWQAEIGGYADRGQLGRLGVIGGVATDRNGHLFVLDSENDRVQVFRSDNGAWLGGFGSTGKQAGEFDLGANTGAGGIALLQQTSADAPIVYVADQLNHRIQRFTLNQLSTLDASGPVLPAGTRSSPEQNFVPVPAADLVWGTKGDCSATGCAGTADRYLLNFPQGVAVAAHDDPAGKRNVYVADDDNHRVVEYTPDGTYLRQVGTFGTGVAQFRFPYDVGVDSKDYLYVADNNNHRVQKFNASDLGFLGLWGGFGSAPGNLEFTRALAALADDPRGGVYVADTANNRVQGFDDAGGQTASWGIAGRGPGYVTRPGGVAVDGAGNVYVADTWNHRIEKLAADGAYLGQFGYVSARSGFAAPNTGNGQFNFPEQVALDTAGNLWITDSGNNRVQVLTPSGVWLATFGGLAGGNGPGQFNDPHGIAVDAGGDVYVADTLNDRIQRRDAATGAWSAVALDRALVDPAAVAVGPGRALFVADRTHVFQVLDGKATEIAPPDGDFDRPGALWFDGANLYVSDTGNGRVVRRRADTGSWETMGAEGLGVGSFVNPAGLTTDPQGNSLYVADQYDNRVQELVFRLRPAPLPPAAASVPRVVRDTRAPRTRLRVRSRQRLRSGAIVLSVRCDEPCTVTGSGYVRIGKTSRLYRLATARRVLRANRPAVLKLRFTVRGRRAIRRVLALHRRLTAHVLLSARDASGNRRSERRSVSLRR
jgi:DNA-binding beta-propeller fold protein YncE